MTVALNRASAVGVWEGNWDEFQKDHPDSAKTLVRLRQTESLSGPAVMASPRMPADHVGRLQAALIGLAAGPNGRAPPELAGVFGIRPRGRRLFEQRLEFF